MAALEITPDKSSGPAVTLRALILGALLIPFNVYWVMMVEGIWHTGHPSCISLPWGVVFNIIILLLVNIFLKRFTPRYAFTQAEFVTIYVMVGIAIMLAGHDTLQLGIPNLTHVWYFANEANGWEKLFYSNLPKWLTVSDMKVLEPYYAGHSTLYTPERMSAFAGPVAWWCGFVLAVGFVMIGINVLLRKQWTEREKLGYPVVQLPLAMTQDGGNPKFFTNRALWVGISIGVALDLWNGLTAFYPMLPRIDVRHDGMHFIDTWSWGLPWSRMGRIQFPLYPFLIAMGFLIPLDLCFSIWFFFIVRKLQEVTAGAVAIPMMPGLPYLTEQSFGAWFMLFGYSMWVGRRYFSELADSIWRGKISTDTNRGDPMSHRAALMAIIGGLAFIIYFCMLAGMTLWVIIPFFAFVFIVHTATTRMRAELGPPAHEMAFTMNSPVLITTFASTRSIGARNLSMFPMFWWLTGRGYRTTPMPIQLEGFKMAEVSGAEPSRLAIGMAIAFLVGGIASMWAAIHLTFQYGTTPLINHNWGQWQQVASYIANDEPASWQKISFIGVGALMTGLMTFMRLNYSWWPLHPAGYALGMLFGVDYFWSCLLIAWLLKWAILRWAGHKSYQRFMPVVFGVIIGEYTMGAFWSAISVIMQRPIYDFSPG